MDASENLMKAGNPLPRKLCMETEVWKQYQGSPEANHRPVLAETSNLTSIVPALMETDIKINTWGKPVSL